MIHHPNHHNHPPHRQVHSDFVSAATRGAMAVIDGNVMAINPGEEAKMQVFILAFIFFLTFILFILFLIFIPSPHSSSL